MEEKTEIDTEKLKKFLKKLTAKDYLIAWLIILSFLIYVLMTRQIDACNSYYQAILMELKTNISMLYSI